MESLFVLSLKNNKKGLSPVGLDINDFAFGGGSKVNDNKGIKAALLYKKHPVKILVETEGDTAYTPSTAQSNGYGFSLSLEPSDYDRMCEEDGLIGIINKLATNEESVLLTPSKKTPGRYAIYGNIYKENQGEVMYVVVDGGVDEMGMQMVEPADHRKCFGDGDMSHYTTVCISVGVYQKLSDLSQVSIDQTRDIKLSRKVESAVYDPSIKEKRSDAKMQSYGMRVVRKKSNEPIDEEEESESVSEAEEEDSTTESEEVQDEVEEESSSSSIPPPPKRRRKKVKKRKRSINDEGKKKIKRRRK